MDGTSQPPEARASIAALQAAAKQAVQSGDIRTAILKFEQLLTYAPANADILSNLGKLHYMAGDLDAAIERFADACGAAPANQALRANYFSALLISAGNHSAAGNIPAAIPMLRTVLSHDPAHPNARVDLANALELSGTRGELSDFIPGATPGQLGMHILIACMPKSGSTFLKEALVALTGFSELPLAYAYLQNEQELHVPNLLRAAGESTVTQQHCRATGPNVQILQGFGIRPVVLVRRVDDIVVSMADFNDAGAVTNTFFGEIWPTLDQKAKYDLIIDHVMPWYASFYASWEQAARHRRLDFLFVTYEEMIADKPAMLAKVADFLQLRKSAGECDAAVQSLEGDATKTRLNQGGAGRGAAALDDDQKARLRGLFAVYGDIDLQRIGLD